MNQAHSEIAETMPSNAPDNWSDGPYSGFFCSQALDLFKAYQDLQRDTGTITPPRQAFNPALVKSILPNVGLLVIDGEMRHTVRLLGTGIVEHLGFDAKGVNYFDFVPPEEKESRWRRLMLSVNQPCGLHSLTTTVFEGGSYASETVLLPMTDKAGEPTHSLAFLRPLEPAEWLFDRGQSLGLGAHHAKWWIDIGSGVPPVAD